MTAITNKQNGVGAARILNAALCSVMGFKAAWHYESAFRQELVLSLLILPFSFVLATSMLEWATLIASVLLVLFAEILNSAIEALADSVTLDHHPLIGRAKDLGSAAVFLALLILLVVWGQAIVGIWL
eukprot:GHVR01153761.1.p1 GENE.GHVR01153761.1~~GHVR01153761.1.p1  ORF type:complete len:128 (+),score=8.72 GHVR01153761.1:182-565(+)